MEQSYVSAAFFRHLTKERLQRHQAEQLLAEGMRILACQGLVLESHVLSCILRGDSSSFLVNLQHQTRYNRYCKCIMLSTLRVVSSLLCLLLSAEVALVTHHCTEESFMYITHIQHQPDHHRVGQGQHDSSVSISNSIPNQCCMYGTAVTLAT